MINKLLYSFLVLITTASLAYSQRYTCYRMKYTDDSERLVYESNCPGKWLSKMFYRMSEIGTPPDSNLTKKLLIHYNEMGLITTIVNEEPMWKTPITNYNYSIKGLNNITQGNINTEEIISVINLLSQKDGLISNWNDTDEYNRNYVIEQANNSILIIKKSARGFKQDTYSCCKTEDNKIDIRLVHDLPVWRLGYVYNYHNQIELDSNYTILLEDQRLPSKMRKYYYYNSDGIPIKEVVIQITTDRNSEGLPLNPYHLKSDTTETNKTIYQKVYYN